MGAVERVKRQATALGFAALVVVLLFVVTAVVPFNLLPIYLAAWFLTLGSLSVKETRFGGSVSEALLFVVDGAALFMFGAVALVSLNFSLLPSVVVSVAGMAVVVYSMSL